MLSTCAPGALATPPPLPPFAHPVFLALPACIRASGTVRALHSRRLSKFGNSDLKNSDPHGLHLKIVAAVARLYMHEKPFAAHPPGAAAVALP